MSIHDTLLPMLQSAKNAAALLAKSDEEVRKSALYAMAEHIRAQEAAICEANKQDLENAQSLPIAMQKRLELNTQKVLTLAKAIEEVAELPDVLGKVKNKWTTKAGLEITQISVPLGVIGVIYESRPNVTSDVASLCFKSGNACILKGGKEAYHSNRAIFGALQSALIACNLPKECICMIEDTSREAITEFVKMDKYVDLLIPRGGEGLIHFVKEHSRIPIIKHDKGVCHTYIHKSAFLPMATQVVLNAKLSYPAACNACECVLIDEALAQTFLPTLIESLHQHNIKVMFENEELLHLFGNVSDGLADFEREWGDKIINLKILSGIDEALAHIARYGSAHSEAIIAQNTDIQERFLNEVDAACVYVNASTRFSDGGEFGFGAEVGISTSKLHARGPMGLESLCSYKYCVRGNGQVRE